jgi:hypothetical protein
MKTINPAPAGCEHSQTALKDIKIMSGRPANGSRCRLLLSLAALLLLTEAGWTAQLVVFDFGRDLATTQKVVQVTALTPLRAVLSTAARDGIEESARAAAWQTATPGNYFRFSFAIEAGYVVDITGVQFDYLSQRTSASAYGPTQYEVRLGTNGGAFRSLSAGWKSLSADAAWHRGVLASNGGVPITNLSGYVTIALAGRGAADRPSRWYVDNIIVSGQVRPQGGVPTQPRLTGFVPHDQVRLSALGAGQYYSLQYASNLASAWKWYPGAANLTSAGPELLADLRGLDGPSMFVRGVTSFGRLPSVDVGGFWRVTSTNPPFGNGIIQLDQSGSSMSFEGRLLGEVKDNAFTIGEDGLAWMSGSVTGDTLRGRYAAPLAGLAGTNDFVAVRYTGPMYDVWEGPRGLTSTQYYDPGANGYTRVGQGNTTATFTVTQPYLVVCANTLTPIDMLEGPNGGFVDDATVLSNWIGNASAPELLKGASDSRAAGVGNLYSGQAYRGYAAFGPVSWRSLTVRLGDLDASSTELIEPIPTNLLRQVFYLEHDSDGTVPASDADVALLFEPGGVAQLYLAFPDYAIAYRGAYAYTNGQLSLKFTDADFNPDVQFAMDLTSPKVSMPFDVFTTGTTGPSVWRREEGSLAHTMWMIFVGATVNEQLAVSQAIGRARAYAEAVRSIPRQAATRDVPEYPMLLSTEPLRNGVRLNYNFGDGKITTMDVELVGRAATPSSTPLGTSSLYSDPRVHLNVADGLSGASDPDHKTALLILPLYTKRILSRNPSDPASVIDNDQAALGMEGLAQKLTAKGYEVRWLRDEDVTVVNLIRELMDSPGLIYFSSHGCEDGRLVTGTYFGTDKNQKAALVEYQRQKELVAAAGYAELLFHDYHGDGPIGFTVVPNGMTKKYKVGMVGIRPAFWDWLRHQGANFDRSLVYIGACQTSERPALRDTIRARALFSFSEEVSLGTLGAVGRYLVESLVRKTRTAEETYYNLRRVVNTHQMIYAEDAQLNGFTDWGDGTTLAAHFHGYATLGPNSTSGPDGIMEYNDIGWLGAASTGKVHAGDVWWLLFAGRWDHSAQGGADAIKRCWDLFYANGQSGGLGEVFCQNCAPGTIPNQDEVAYAIYLLTAQWALPFSGITAPRWTLYDGAP